MAKTDADSNPIVTAKLTFKLHGDKQNAVKLTIINCNKYFIKFFVFKIIYILQIFLIMFKILKNIITISYK